MPEHQQQRARAARRGRRCSESVPPSDCGWPVRLWMMLTDQQRPEQRCRRSSTRRRKRLAPVPEPAPGDDVLARAARGRRRRGSASGISLWARTSTRPRKAMTPTNVHEQRRAQAPAVGLVEDREEGRAGEDRDERRGARQPPPLMQKRELLLVARPLVVGVCGCVRHAPVCSQQGTDEMPWERELNAPARNRSPISGIVTAIWRRDPWAMMAEVTRIACSACGYELWSSWTHELDACTRCGAVALDTTTRHVPDTQPAIRRAASPVGTDA